MSINVFEHALVQAYRASNWLQGFPNNVNSLCITAPLVHGSFACCNGLVVVHILSKTFTRCAAMSRSK